MYKINESVGGTNLTEQLKLSPPHILNQLLYVQRTILHIISVSMGDKNLFQENFR